MLREGCFKCLQDALAIYERLSASPRATDHVARSAFAAAVLLTMRAKELGLASEPYMGRARALAARVPSSATSAFEPTLYLDGANYFVGDISGLDPPIRQTRSRRQRSAGDVDPAIAKPLAALATVAATDLTAEYVRLSIQCETRRDRSTVNPSQLRARHGNAPLIRFRLALCGLESAALPELRTQDARWADTLFFEGQRELAMRPVADVEKAAAFFAAAHEAFPESIAITLALANSRNSQGEYESALRSFDRVLSAEATHRDALLGRVMSLSYLTRHTEAVASATRMIELGTWHIGDAYYWRAWNRYHLYALESAWADVERATGLLVNTSVYTLAGFIAYARKELDTAIDRFDRAFAIDKSNCEACGPPGSSMSISRIGPRPRRNFQPR
jgi:tetratricopeptide (TPR) repeat protein